MNKVRLGLGMIVKDEVEDIERILSNYKHLFGEIQITITSPEKRGELESICVAHGAVPSYYDWKSEGHTLFPFDLARNFNMAQFKNSDYYFRLDSDDEIRGVENVGAIAQKAHDNDVSMVLCFYEYSKDQWGNVVAGHNRETFIQLTDNVKWNKHIHENLIAIDKRKLSVVIDPNVVIVHRASEEKAEESSARNLKYLIEEYNRDKEKTDSRTLAYLGRVFFSLQDYEKAIFFLQKHIETSGWDEDRYLSWCYLSELYSVTDKLDLAVSAASEAILERPDYPNAYHQLSFIYYQKQEWMKSIEFGKIGATKKAPDTTMLLDPSATTFRPAVTMALSYFQVGKFSEAKRLFDYAKKMAPTHPFIKDNDHLFQRAVSHRDFISHFTWILNYLRNNDESKAKELVKAIPDEILEEPTMCGIKNTFTEAKTWPDNSVVFFCGSAWEEWSPKSVGSGIGGSEEAVIHMSRELVKLGYDVTVYNSCGSDEGIHDGVKYVNHYKFSKKDFYNILIAWRNNAFEFGLNARKRFLWIHDVPYTLLNSPDECAQTDKAIVLSEYHKSLLAPKFPEEKIFVSTNGVNYKDFEFDEKIERDPNRMIFASSHVRGIIHLLRVWKEIREANPKATLHLYYGWDTYDKMLKEGYCDGKEKAEIVALCNQEGITDHGRIGHRELAKEYLKAGIWVYPSHFPEISCIAAMKAQVAGCVPVFTDFAALKETVKAGIVIPGNAEDPNVFFEWKMALIELLKNPEAQEEIRSLVLKHREEFHWKDVAKQWSEELFSSVESREFIKCRLAWVRSMCTAGEKIVDIGGNKGHTFDGWNRDDVTTVDMDKYEIPNFYQADATNLPFGDKTFDVACLNEVMEHMPDPVSALKEAKRVAKKRIVITVPNEHEWLEEQEPFTTIEMKCKREGKTREELAREGNIAVAFDTKDNYEHLYHVRYYTKELLEQHLREAGIDNYKIIKMNQGVWAFYGCVVEL